MMKEERQRFIIDRINKEQKINLVELGQVMNVSYDSLRRDVIELEDKGLLKKVHGGAVANSYLSHKAAQGLGVANQEVIELCRKVNKLIEGKRIIMMDGGTTNFHIAEQFSKNLKITVITNNIPLATTLSDFPNIETILIGGSYFQRYQITIGSEAIRQVEQFRPDLYLMGCNGIHPQSGVTLRHYEEAKLKERMAQVSREVVVCAIPEKLNFVESFKVCDISEIDVLLTTVNLNNPAILPFKDCSLRLL